MAQPFDQSCVVPAMGDVDVGNRQFWVGNPWLFRKTSFNLSAYERNRVYCNTGDGTFTEVSYLTGADSDSDSRGVAAADLDNDGRADLLVRNVGGGPIRIYLNRFPPKRYLKVRLRGEPSNGPGIGARLVARVGTRRIYREMQASNTFWAQNPPEVIFGLGDATLVDELTVMWPSGTQQKFERIAADHAIEIHEQRGLTKMR